MLHSEEVRIYHSLWRMLLLILGCAVFVAIGIAMVRDPRLGAVNIAMAWLGIVFFGLGGIALLFWLLTERLTRRSFLTINDESVVYSSPFQQYEIRFADVESFVMLGVKHSKMIGIRYKEGVERQKLDDATFLGRLARKFNLSVSGTQESIAVTGLTIKAQELLDWLTDRLQQSQR